MSVEINWDTLTAGADGKQRAETIRNFIHAKFQNVPRPKFIQSIKVVSFDFGDTPPDIVLKDICDPYPEFYEEEYAGEEEEEEELNEDEIRRRERELRRRERKAARDSDADKQSHAGSSSTAGGGSSATMPPPYNLNTDPTRLSGLRPAFSPGADSLRGVSTPLFPLAAAPPSHLHYFHSALSSGFNGTTTPLPFQPTGPNSPLSAHALRQLSRERPSTPESPSSFDFNRPTSVTGSDPPSEDGMHEPPSTPTRPPLHTRSSDPRPTTPPPRLHLREPRDTDLQVVSHVRYTGNMRMEITCELLIDYPAVSFIALPVRLVISGFSFDGLFVSALIRKQLHVCFLESEEETERLIGSPGGVDKRGGRGGGMLKEIKVESEIGEKGRGKQVLKNVGKVERFVLEQVRRIFEDEFVFPSSWTFLI